MLNTTIFKLFMSQELQTAPVSQHALLVSSCQCNEMYMKAGKPLNLISHIMHMQEPLARITKKNEG